MQRFPVHWRLCGGHHVFNFHSAWGMVRRAARQGNPTYYWTYADEQMNRLIGAVAKSCHAGGAFYMALLEKVLWDPGDQL
eukprot:2906895-Pyramimonas_sp.AAC.1